MLPGLFFVSVAAPHTKTRPGRGQHSDAGVRKVVQVPLPRHDHGMASRVQRHRRVLWFRPAVDVWLHPRRGLDAATGCAAAPGRADGRGRPRQRRVGNERGRRRRVQRPPATQGADRAAAGQRRSRARLQRRPRRSWRGGRGGGGCVAVAALQVGGLRVGVRLQGHGHGGASRRHAPGVRLPAQLWRPRPQQLDAPRLPVGRLGQLLGPQPCPARRLRLVRRTVPPEWRFVLHSTACRFL